MDFCQKADLKYLSELNTSAGLKYLVVPSRDSCIVSAYALGEIIVPHIPIDQWESYQDLDKVPDFFVIWFGSDNTSISNDAHKETLDFDYDHVAMVCRGYVYDSYYLKRTLERRQISEIDLNRIVKGLDWDILIPEYHYYDTTIPRIARISVPTDSDLADIFEFNMSDFFRN